MNIRTQAKAGWFDGERVLGTSPELSIRIDEDWYQRPYLFTGRALTDTTLISQVKHRIRHMQLFGQHLSPGTIHGLELTFNRRPAPEEADFPTEDWLQLTSGLGLCLYGDDVSVPYTINAALDTIKTIGAETPPRGTGVFLLQPIEIIDEVGKNPESQCQWDPEKDPFDDEQILDGCRIVFYPWPIDPLKILPVPINKLYRNRLVYRIFTYEQSHPGTTIPWEDIGLPLGLTHINNKGQISFIDRFAVVRQGGASLSNQPALSVNGSPFLWEARIQQLHRHIFDLIQLDESVPSATEYFEVLPPVGLLPSQVLDFASMSTGFFPSQFSIEAVPIPEEQLEIALNASAGLQPFDLHRPEKIKLLVPVPQAVYEPDLLKKEIVDPIFLETLRKLIQEIRKWKANREYLREMAPEVIGAIDYNSIPIYGEDDEEIPDEKKFEVTVPYDNTLTQFDTEAKSIIQELRTWIASHTRISNTSLDFAILTPENLGKPEFPGLEDFITELEKKVTDVEDRLGTHFLKVESDIFRLRQLILGNQKASRLATSSVTGQLIQGQTKTPTIDQVESWFAKIAPVSKSEEKPPTPPQPEEEEPQPASAETAPPPPGKAGAGPTTMALTGFLNPNYIQFADYFKKIAYIPPKMVYQAKAVSRYKPIVERVYESPSMESKSNAVITKALIFGTLASLKLDINEELQVTSGENAILNPGQFANIIAELGGPDDPRAKILTERRRFNDDFVVLLVSPLTADEIKLIDNDDQARALDIRLGEFRDKNKVAMKTENLSKSIRNGFFDPDPTDGDEANFFSVGVMALEHGLEAIRKVDDVLNDYKKALAQAKKTMVKVKNNAKAWSDTLEEIDEKIIVHRHDALITRSLFDEETARVNEINEKRKSILDTWVSSVAFTRPRMVDSRLDAPVVKLRAEYVNPLPECLAQDYEATDELEDMLDVFREVPLNWFKIARTFVKELKHPFRIAEVIKNSSFRATKVLQQKPILELKSATLFKPNQFNGAITSIVTAQVEKKKQILTKKKLVDTGVIATKTWTSLVKQAEEDLSLADLIEAGKGQSALARKANGLMENFEDVAVCLYNRLNELEPSIKLAWAHKLSIYDKPVDLQSLADLPSWHKIEFVMGKDLQNYVDWLFDQIDDDNSDAKSLINDLVRVCILLASHAPVSTIISGYTSKPSQGRIGDVIDTIIDRGRIAIGMRATFLAKGIIAAQGIVEDIGKNTGRIKITQSTNGKKSFNIDKGVKVKFHKMQYLMK